MRYPKILQRLLKDSNGATAIEYGLIVSLVVIAMIGALQGVANENTGLWGRVSSTIIAATSA